MALTKIPANLLDKSAHVDFADNERLRIGTDNDLQIHYDGTNNLIQGSAGNVLYIQAKAGENSILAIPDGAVTLYHNNVLKFETSSAGATVTGTLTVTGDLDITGNVNSASVTDLDVTDKTITLGVGQTEAQSGGSGIVIDGSAASFTWDETNDRWLANKKLAILEDVIVNANAGNDTNVEVGAGTSQNHYSYIDLIGDTTYTDYGLRIIRNNGGANTSSGIHHRGTGNLFIRTEEDAPILFLTKMNSGGAERMRIVGSTGNVGIGTSSPDGKLEVAGGSTGIVLSNAGDSSAYDQVAMTYNGYNSGTPEFVFKPKSAPGSGTVNSFFRFSTLIGGGSNIANVTVDGKVGIGTSSPSQALHIAGGSGSMILNESTSWSNLRLKSPNANGGYIQFADADDDDVGQIFYYHGSGGDYMSFTTNASERMRIDSNGNLLVGATSFQHGSFGGNSRGINVAGVQPLVLLHETDTDKDAYLGISGSNLFLGTADDIGIRFHTNDTERMRLLGNGNFGIGTTSAGTSLQIGDGTGDEYITIDKSATGASGILFKNAGNNKVKLLCNSSEEFELHVNNALKMYVNEDGDVGIGISTPHGRLHVSGANANEAQVYQTTTCKEYRNVCTSWTTTSTSRYWHIKTNIATSNNIMFVGHVEGYAYGASGHIVDVKRSGYMYASTASVINSQTVNNGSGSATLNTYSSSDGYLTFVCDFGGGYYSGGAFHIQFPAPAGYNVNFSIQAHDMNNTSTGHY